MRRIDVSGERFSKLVAIEYFGKSYWTCRCDCGNIKVIHLQKMKSGWTKSCGCIQKEWARDRQYKHGKTRTSIYRIYRGMLRRCYDVDNPAYHNYGGRGIDVCGRWLESFSNFYSDMGDKPENMSLDRINNNKGYSLENCKWSTQKQQSNNKRTNVYYEYNGVITTQMIWSKMLGATQSGLRYYVKSHSPREAIEHYIKKNKINIQQLASKKAYEESL